MKLPNAHLAVVEREKVVDCLLNPVHRYGASKAHFFAEFGFQMEAWEILAAGLREHGQRHEVVKVKETGFGPRYEVDGELRTPSSQQPRVRTILQLDHGNIAPRLITAHPLEAHYD